jgi:hypothetical protein
VTQVTNIIHNFGLIKTRFGNKQNSMYSRLLPGNEQKRKRLPVVFATVISLHRRLSPPNYCCDTQAYKKKEHPPLFRGRMLLKIGSYLLSHFYAVPSA